MPVNYSFLIKHTRISVQQSMEGIQLLIETPRLRIRSVEEDDIPFYQELWKNPEVMEKFAEGKPRLYSGTKEEKQAKLERNVEPDYALWRIKTDKEASWLKRRQDGNLWHGLTICDKKSNARIGHIILGGGELAYFITPSLWNQKYASEAALALVGVALPVIAENFKTISIPSEIKATVRTDHNYSKKVLKSIGFEFSDTTKQTVNDFGHTRYEVTAPASMFIARYNIARSNPKLEVGDNLFFTSANKKGPVTGAVTSPVL